MHYPIKIVIQKRLSDNFISIWFCVFVLLGTTVKEKRYNIYIKTIVIIKILIVVLLNIYCFVCFHGVG